MFPDAQRTASDASGATTRPRARRARAVRPRCRLTLLVLGVCLGFPCSPRPRPRRAAGTACRAACGSSPRQVPLRPLSGPRLDRAQRLRQAVLAAGPASPSTVGVAWSRRSAGRRAAAGEPRRPASSSSRRSWCSATRWAAPPDAVRAVAPARVHLRRRRHRGRGGAPARALPAPRLPPGLHRGRQLGLHSRRRPRRPGHPLQGALALRRAARPGEHGDRHRALVGAEPDPPALHGRDLQVRPARARVSRPDLSPVLRTARRRHAVDTGWRRSPVPGVGVRQAGLRPGRGRVALVAFSPLLAALASPCASTRQGPVIFSQPRWGGGTAPSARSSSGPCTRTASAGSGALLHNPAAEREYERYRKLDNDPRVTRAGRLMRARAWTSCRSSSTCCAAR